VIRLKSGNCLLQMNLGLVLFGIETSKLVQ